MALSESDGFVTLNVTTYYTSGIVDKSGITELKSANGLIEILLHAASLRVGRITAIGKHVTALDHLNEVVSYGHAYGERSVLGTFNDLAVTGADHSVHVEVGTLNGIIGT